MSVINKMLRDLDARRAGGALPELQRQGGPDALLGTLSIGSSREASSARRRRWWLAAMLLLAGAALAAWYFLDGEPALSITPATPAVMAPPPAVTASVPLVSASTPASPASVPVAPQAPSAVASAPAVVSALAAVPASGVAPAAVLPASAAPKLADTPALPAAKTPPGERAAPPVHAPRTAVTAVATEKPGVPALTPARQTPAPAVPAQRAASAPAPSTVTAGPAERRLAAARETLAQAQALWGAGSREAAVSMVREAVLLAGRGQAVDTAVLAMLVREQARMELALGRPAAVLELLSRLEPALATQADLWAVRGNAAQRLGRHPEAVQSYLKALQLRPGESRWMLGAAVSLAAQGLLDAAAQQAEQARALGPVSPEVLNYLRQAGVPLR